MATQQELEKLIRKIDDLPTLPTVYAKLAETINNPSTTARDVSKILSHDQALTAKLLRLVNSAFYGFPSKISTITQAVVILGFSALKNLVLTTSVFDLFAGDPNKTKIHQGEFLKHAVGTAVGALIIGKSLSYPEPEELFVAGLLHDIGKLAENLFLHDRFAEVVEVANNENIFILRAEIRLLGFSHAHVGKLLLQKWKLPQQLIEIIANHHNIQKARVNIKQTAIIQLADILCRSLELGYAGDNLIPCLESGAWDIIKLNPGALERIIKEIDMGFNEAIQSLGFNN